MDYELAKQLKEAGFPQEMGSESFGEGIPYTDEYVKLPTLSELVEECGSSLKTLWNLEGVKWFAASFLVNVDGASQEGTVCRGKTPEEAVAKLWLALNKNV